MDARLHVSRLSGQATVPPSKSAAHRAVLCAALADGVSHITNIEYSQDIRATLGAVTQLGAKVAEEPAAVTITGRGSSGGFVTVTRPVFCNESGSTLRFMIPLFSLTAQKVRFTGAGRLFDRPQAVYQMLFDRQGLRFEQTSEGVTVFGRLRPGGFTLPGDVSSQFITGLLFALPLLEGDSDLLLTAPLESRGYVDLTLDVLDRFGVVAEPRENGFHIPSGQMYQARDLAVEADWSQAAFWYAANHLGGQVDILGMDPASRQGDREIAAYSRMLARSGQVELDVSQCPDLAPPLAAMAAVRTGTTRLTNAARLRAKESDRLASVTRALRAMGGQVEEYADSLTIHGVKRLPGGGVVDCANDHRIAMMAAVCAASAEAPVKLLGAECVRKSYPEFWTHFQSLGGELHGLILR